MLKKIFFLLLVTSQAMTQSLVAFEFSIDYLLLRPHVDGIFTAVDENQKAKHYSDQKSAINLIILDEEADFCAQTRRIDFTAHSGVRLKATIPCGNSTLGFAWTFFNPSEMNSIHKGSPQLIPLTTTNLFSSVDSIRISQLNEMTQNNDSFFNSQIRADRVHSNWDLSLNLFDLELSQSGCWGNWELNPKLGLRLGWIDQELAIKSHNIIEGVSVVSGIPFTDLQTAGRVMQLAEANAKERICQEYLGMGPRLSIDLKRPFWCGFLIEGTAGVSLLYGENTLTVDHQADRFNGAIPELDTDTFHIHRHDEKWCLKPILDLFLGVSWRWCCTELQLGWENHYFFNHSLVAFDFTDDFFHVHEDPDLSMQGLRLSGRVSF